MSLFGPGETLHRVRQIEGAPEGESYEGEFAFTQLRLATPTMFGPMDDPAVPCPAPRGGLGLRIEGPSQEDPARRVACSTRGTRICGDSIVEGARGVDVLLSEVGFTSDEREPDMHMDGRRAGELATRAGVGRMIATHIQPWTPSERVVSEVRQTWAGPLDVAAARMEVSF